MGREDTRGGLNGQGRFVRTETLQLRKQMQSTLQKGFRGPADNEIPLLAVCKSLRKVPGKF